jgi:DNA-binding transcriptional regulator YiaG
VPFSKTALRRARQARGLSQPELAAILGCPLRTLRSWEWGERAPTEEKQLLIARRLHVELVDLHEPVDRQPVTAA